MRFPAFSAAGVLRTAFLPAVALVGGLAVGPSLALAQDNSRLSGLYTIHASGQAQLTNPNGNCAATGLVAASLNGYIVFDGQGSFSQGNIGISVGATTCTYPNYGV